jgi:hypothetical protein
MHGYPPLTAPACHASGDICYGFTTDTLEQVVIRVQPGNSTVTFVPEGTVSYDTGLIAITPEEVNQSFAADPASPCGVCFVAYESRGVVGFAVTRDPGGSGGGLELAGLGVVSVAHGE